MNSVISQEELAMLLRSMQDSIPISKVLMELSSASRINEFDKNNLFHGIKSVIKNNSDPNEASKILLEEFISFLNDRLNGVSERIHPEPESPRPDKTRKSPIFSRVG